MDIQHQTGHVAELYAAYRLARLGYRIHWPSTAQSRYDLLIEFKSQYFRVQVKKATWSTTEPYQYLQARIKSRNKGGKLYLPSEIDYFIFVDYDTDRLWLVNIKELEGLTSACLDGTNPKYKGQKGYDPKKWLI